MLSDRSIEQIARRERAGTVHEAQEMAAELLASRAELLERQYGTGTKEQLPEVRQEQAEH